MNNKCTSCLFFGNNCHSNKVCDFYAPLDNNLTDEDVEKHIAYEKGDYVSDWFEYISEFN